MVSTGKKSLWVRGVRAMKAKFGYNWDISKWSNAYKYLSTNNSEEIVKDICKFIQEDEANLDVLRKCFLVQVIYKMLVLSKRTHQKISMKVS